MIMDGNEWYYVANTKLYALLNANTLKYKIGVSGRNCLNSVRIKNKRDFYQKICINLKFCESVTVSVMVILKKQLFLS